MPDNFDAYIKFKGITGECLDKEFTGKKVSELVTMSISPGQQTFTITKPTDSASPQLHNKYCLNFSKNDDAKAEIECVRVWVRKDTGGAASSALSGATGKYPAAAYIIFEFTGVRVKSFDWKVSEAGESEDEVTCSFSTCLVKHRKQTATGALTAWSTPGAWNFDDDTPDVTEKGDAGVF